MPPESTGCDEVAQDINNVSEIENVFSELARKELEVKSMADIVSQESFPTFLRKFPTALKLDQTAINSDVAIQGIHKKILEALFLLCHCQSGRHFWHSSIKLICPRPTLSSYFDYKQHPFYSGK